MRDSVSHRQSSETACPPLPRTQPAGGGGLWAGLLLTGGIAGFALTLHWFALVPGLSPLILAIAIGMAIGNGWGVPVQAKAGITFSIKRLLRIAVALLGLQLTIGQVIEVGATGLAIIAASLVATFVFTIWAGRRLGIDRRLTELIGAGTAVCGASAVIAANTVSAARDEDVAYAVACVTVFGSLSMLLFPLLPGLLQLDAQAYGLWAGAAIHEVAQVVAAAFQGGQAAGEYGTIAKLSRVMMLAPLVLVLGVYVARRNTAGGRRPAAKPPLPWFVFGFILLMVAGSVFPVPEAAKAGIGQVTTFLLCLSLAAMGLETDVRKLWGKGARPLLLGAAAWLFISVFSLILVKLVY
ncbi:YeiH family protein [Telmatospirillum sp. J64-1]|uniref:YeiH family protein n=1 Tax=Telmatospirillum sp. J64-1 TaxID=2502183 RepID=UPI00115CCEB6|nr:YeiH family protein [Telmatospirillum sp. J64-1]